MRRGYYPVLLWRTTWLRPALTLFLATSLALLLAEVALRLTVVPLETSYHFAKNAVVADPVIGYRLRPNQRTIMTNGHFVEEVVTNALGLRDVERDDWPSPGLIAIGDSQTFGHGIPAEETWVEQLQEQLHVNVVNAGVFGYGVTQYPEVVRRLHDEGYPLRVVLFGMTWNDVFSGEAAPDTNTVVDGYLVQNPIHASAARHGSLLGRIRASQLGEYATRRFALGHLLRGAVPTLMGRLGLSPDPDIRLHLESDAKKTLEVLTDLAQYLRSIDARLVIVHLADANLVMSERWAEYRRRYDHSRYFAREVLAGWAAQEDVLFADATDALEACYVEGGSKRTAVLLPVNDHYNARANAVIAGLFRAMIERHGLLDDGLRLEPLHGAGQPHFERSARDEPEALARP